MLISMNSLYISSSSLEYLYLKKIEISTLDPNYNYTNKLSPFNHTSSLGPGPHGAPVVAPPVPEAGGVGVGVDVVASVQPLADQHGLGQQLLAAGPPRRGRDLLQVREVAQRHGVARQVAEVVAEPEQLLLEAAHLEAVQGGADGEVDGGHEGGDLLLAAAHHGPPAHVQPRLPHLGLLHGLASLVLVALAVPGHLGRLLLRPEHDPGVVLGQREVHVGEAEQLTARHHGEGHAEAVELVAGEVAVEGLEVGAVLVLALGQGVPHNVRHALHQAPGGIAALSIPVPKHF